MKFLLDQDVYAATARFLAGLGHDVIQVVQIGLSQATDERLGEVQVEMADQSVKKACVCGPLRVQIGEFRPIAAEVLFLDMEPDEDGEYEPLVGYIALEQAGAAVDMLGHRLVHVKRLDLK